MKISHHPGVPILLAAGLWFAATTLPARAQEPAGGTDIAVVGLDDTLKKLGQMKGNRDALQAQLFLNLFKGLARPGQAEGGRARLDYHVDIADNGHVLVNGQDLTALIEITRKLAPKG